MKYEIFHIYRTGELTTNANHITNVMQILLIYID